MSFKRREGVKNLGKGPNGRNLCFCGCGKEAIPPRRNWHSKDCVAQWRIRNDPGYVGRMVYHRDKGICAECGLDTEREERIALETNRMWQSLIRLEHLDHRWTWEKHREEVKILEQRKKEKGWHKRHFWEADHIVPVSEGGGQCGLEGYRTLCTLCHLKVTRELHLRLKRKRQNQPVLL